jgi:hypothetical protein
MASMLSGRVGSGFTAFGSVYRPVSSSQSSTHRSSESSLSLFKLSNAIRKAF